MDIIIQILLNALGVYVVALLLPGVDIKNFFHAILAAVFISLANTFIRPVLEFISFPLTVITLGLFRLVITAVILLLVDWLLPGMKIRNFWWAVLMGLLLSLLNYFFGIASF